jgi:hypothetical protein
MQLASCAREVSKGAVCSPAVSTATKRDRFNPPARRAAVYKGVCKRSREVVVLKSYTLGSICELYQHQIYREVRLHSSMQHENVVKLYAAFKEGDRVVMVQEYADGGDLFSLLQKYGGRLGEKVAVQMVLDPFLRVLQYLHTRGIVHRDIKPGEWPRTQTRGSLARVLCWFQLLLCFSRFLTASPPSRPTPAREHPVHQGQHVPQAGRLWPGHRPEGGAGRDARRHPGLHGAR